MADPIVFTARWSPNRVGSASLTGVVTSGSGLNGVVFRSGSSTFQVSPPHYDSSESSDAPIAGVPHSGYVNFAFCDVPTDTTARHLAHYSSHHSRFTAECTISRSIEHRDVDGHAAVDTSRDHHETISVYLRWRFNRPPIRNVARRVIRRLVYYKPRGEEKLSLALQLGCLSAALDVGSIFCVLKTIIDGIPDFLENLNRACVHPFLILQHDRKLEEAPSSPNRIHVSVFATYI